jgi:hypothetical protein
LRFQENSTTEWIRRLIALYFLAKYINFRNLQLLIQEAKASAPEIAALSSGEPGILNNLASFLILTVTANIRRLRAFLAQ